MDDPEKQRIAHIVIERLAGVDDSSFGSPNIMQRTQCFFCGAENKAQSGVNNGARFTQHAPDCPVALARLLRSEGF